MTVGIYDLVVIGAGPGGYVAALRAAQMGLKVAVVERYKPGGTCLHRGCIPTKAFIASAEVFRAAATAAGYGIRCGKPEASATEMAARKDRIVGLLNGGIEALFKKRGVVLIKGSASFADPRTVRVETADGTVTLGLGKCIIATGSAPARVPGIEIDGNTIVTSDEIVNLREIPREITILGAGVIGCEFACLFASLGCRVRVVELLDRCLPGFDEDLAREIAKAMKKLGIELRLGARAEKAGVSGGRVSMVLAGGERIEADRLLVAVGRTVDTSRLGLDAAGVRTNPKGRIPVNAHCQTNVPHIYAVGDVAADVVQLAHTASRMGVVAAEHAAGRTAKFDPMEVPSVMYGDLEVAGVGLTEDAARAGGRKVLVGKFHFRGLGKAHCDGRTDGFCKVIGDAVTHRVLGVHIVCAGASNLISEGVLAVRLQARLEDLAEMVHPHPTMSEAIMEAAGAALGCGTHSA
ncbi:MAG: dihydrolipoyl dehydrogenase [Planctomycetota bacterium]|nr:dihydrolipoyl dehydrogenase [Planctomycetota bacterium]